MILTAFDILTLTIILASSILGLYRGVINILVNFLGFIASIILAFILYPYIVDIFDNYVKNELVISIASGLISYILSLILFTFLTSKILLLFSESTGGFFDRSLGGVIGFIRGFLFSVVIFAITAVFTSGIYLKAENVRSMLLELDKKEFPDWLGDSSSLKYFENATKNIVLLFPKDKLEAIKLPSTKKEEDEEDIIEQIKKKKLKEQNSDGVNSTIDIPLDEELEKSINELGL